MFFLRHCVYTVRLRSEKTLHYAQFFNNVYAPFLKKKTALYNSSRSLPLCRLVVKTPGVCVEPPGGPTFSSPEDDEPMSGLVNLRPIRGPLFVGGVLKVSPLMPEIYSWGATFHSSSDFRGECVLPSICPVRRRADTVPPQLLLCLSCAPILTQKDEK